jgi:hypothetical protein
MPQFIAYTLKASDEYVVGVNEWIVYDSLQSAVDSLFDHAVVWYDWIGGVSRQEILLQSYAIGTHTPVLAGVRDTRGYIARVA